MPPSIDVELGDFLRVYYVSIACAGLVLLPLRLPDAFRLGIKILRDYLMPNAR